MLLCASIREVKVKKSILSLWSSKSHCVSYRRLFKNLCWNRPQFHTEEQRLPGEAKCLCLKPFIWNLYWVECWMDPVLSTFKEPPLGALKLGQVDWQQNHWNIVCRRPLKLSSPVLPPEQDYQQNWTRWSIGNPQRWSPGWVMHCISGKKGWLTWPSLCGNSGHCPLLYHLHLLRNIWYSHFRNSQS